MPSDSRADPDELMNVHDVWMTDRNYPIYEVGSKIVHSPSVTNGSVPMREMEMKRFRVVITFSPCSASYPHSL